MSKDEETVSLKRNKKNLPRFLFSSEFLNCPCFPRITIYRQYLCYWEDSAGRTLGGIPGSDIISSAQQPPAGMARREKPSTTDEIRELAKCLL